MRRLPVIIVLAGLSVFGSVGRAEMIEENKTNLVEVQGTLIKVKMTNFDWNPWEEYALQDEDGNLTLLIGEKAELLREYIGKKLAVKGLPKPPLSCKGEKTATVEIKEFTVLENKDRGD